MALLWRSAYKVLLVIAERNPHRKARNAVIGQLLESHGQPLAHIVRTLLIQDRAILSRATRADGEGNAARRAAHPEDASLFLSLALSEVDHLVFVV
jgi:hypothetical protein